MSIYLSTETMQKCPSVDVPEADWEIDWSWHQVGYVVPRVLVVRVQQAVYASGMAQ